MIRFEDGQSLPLQKTPLLPDQWPNPQGVTIYGYDSQPAPTGVVSYDIYSPNWQFTVVPLTADPIWKQLQPTVRIGRQIDQVDDGLDDRLAVAEQVLVEVIAGCRTAQESCDALTAYQEWFDANTIVAHYLLKQLHSTFPCQTPSP